MIKCDLSPAETQTAYGPLCALGHYLRQNHVLQPLEQIHLPQKKIHHSPTQKLLDALIGILAGCPALYQLNVKVRPDRPLQLSFGRERCADQSTVVKTFTAETVEELRRAVETIHRRQGRVFTHDFLILEVDLTGLTASKNAEKIHPWQAQPPGAATGAGDRPAIRGGALREALPREHG